MGATNAIEVGSNIWNARVYAGLSVASELADSLDRPTVIGFPLHLSWRIYRSLRRLTRDLDEMLSEYDRPKPIPPELPIEMIRRGRDILLKLHEDCKRLRSVPDGAVLGGPINRRIARLQEQSERLLDVADWFDAISSPDETKAKFDRALADLAKGDVVPWSLVQ